MTAADPYRTKDLARIHLAKKQLGLDDEAYRDILRQTTGKTSSADLSPKERFKLLRTLQELGAKDARSYPGKPAKPAPDQKALLAKIEAQLAVAQRPWSYADAMARHMFKREQVGDCEHGELVRLVAALAYDAKRREAKAAKAAKS